MSTTSEVEEYVRGYRAFIVEAQRPVHKLINRYRKLAAAARQEGRDDLAEAHEETTKELAELVRAIARLGDTQKKAKGKES